MTESGREMMPGARERESGIRSRVERRLPVVFLGLLIVGVGGAFAFDARWVKAIVNHLAGLGILGLLACLAAYIAKKKGRDPRTAFMIGSLLPIGLGILAVILVYVTTRFVYCGGGVILVSALLVIVGYSCSWRRRTGNATS